MSECENCEKVKILLTRIEILKDARNTYFEKSKQLESELAAYRWIPVAERLPEGRWPVLVSNGLHVWKDAYFAEEKTWDKLIPGGGRLVTYTHWMPIPSLPEQPKPTNKPFRKEDYGLGASHE